MISLSQKKQQVEELVGLLKDATGVYLVNYRAMSVEETNKFRDELRAGGIKYKVAKNTLLRKALEQTEGLEFPADKLKEPSGLVITTGDPTAPSKIIKKAFEKGEKPVLKAALLDGQYFDGSQLKTIASLPSKEDMIAAIMGSLNAPASGIVGSINAVIRDVASLIEEVAKKQNNAA
jgi:large subunit ribosomal protein L10